MQKGFSKDFDQKKTFNKKPMNKAFTQANSDARKAFAAGEVFIMDFLLSIFSF